MTSVMEPMGHSKRISAFFRRWSSFVGLVGNCDRSEADTAKRVVSLFDSEEILGENADF